MVKVSNLERIASWFLLMLAAGVLAMASRYDIGTAAQMGAGYFPAILGVVLLLLSLVLLISSKNQAEPLAVIPAEWRSLTAVVLSVVIFGLLLTPAGFLLTVALTAFVSSMGSASFRWKRSVVIAVLLSLSSYCVFVLGLEMRIPALPRFLGG